VWCWERTKNPYPNLTSMWSNVKVVVGLGQILWNDLRNRNFFPMAQQALVGQASSLSRFYDHFQMHNTRYDSFGRVIISTQRPVPDNTRHSSETDIHDRGGIRTHKPRKQAAADPRLRPRGHWDWQKWKNNCVFGGWNFANLCQPRSLEIVKR
jgi:hypothetical protein